MRSPLVFFLGCSSMSESRIVHVPAAAPTLSDKLLRRLSLLPFLSDEAAVKLMYRSSFRQALDLRSPTTFNQKLQWLKLHDRNPLYTTLVDKYAVKEWVSDRIGHDRVIPILDSGRGSRRLASPPSRKVSCSSVRTTREVWCSVRMLSPLTSARRGGGYPARSIGTTQR